MRICKKNLAGILLISLILCPVIINYINSVIKEEPSLQVKTETNDKNDIKNPKNADAFVPDPALPHDGMEWNFTADTVIGWRQYSSWGVSDYIYNISDLKYYDESDNVTGSNEAYYGVALTPAYWNVSTEKVEEYTNRTVFPILNVSLINYTIPLQNGFSNRNLLPSSDYSPDFLLNSFIPKNSSDVLDIHWCANATHWLISAYLNGNYDEENDELLTPQFKEELVELTVTSNSIHYVNPAKGTYCHLFYYDNGTLRTGEIYVSFTAEFTFKINKTRIFDFNPMNELKWSEDFHEHGDELFVGMDTNETELVFNHTVNNMELKIEWNDEYKEWEIELLYYQEIWANVSYWNYEDKKWIYLNCTPVASANDIYPIVFGGDDDDDEEDNDEMLLPPFLLIPNQSTFLSLGDVFKIFEFNPEWSDLRVETEDNWVKLTNTTTSNIVVFSYQIDGILEYVYLQGVGPFEEMTKDGDDEDILFYYKNNTNLMTGFNTFPLHTFDLESLSVVINISLSLQSGFFHSGFPYNPTNQSIDNALGFFDIFMLDESYLVQAPYFAPINITFYYDHTTYKSVKVYWFNMSADNHKGAWEEIPIKNLGDGVILVTLNHTSIIVFTAIKIESLPSDDDDDDEKEKPAIPIGNYYLIFIALAIIGLVIYKKRNF